MDVSHAILFLENADFVRITGLYFPAKFELYIQDKFSKIDKDGKYFFNYIILIFAEQNWNS